MKWSPFFCSFEIFGRKEALESVQAEVNLALRVNLTMKRVELRRLAIFARNADLKSDVGRITNHQPLGLDVLKKVFFPEVSSFKSGGAYSLTDGDLFPTETHSTDISILQISVKDHSPSAFSMAVLIVKLNIL